MESSDIQQLAELINEVADDKQPIAEQLLKELVFMSGTLENLKATIREKGEIDLFKQGKQEFLRESPAMKTYNTTVQRYSLLLKQFADLLPQTDAYEGSELFEFLRQD